MRMKGGGCANLYKTAKCRCRQDGCFAGLTLCLYPDKTKYAISENYDPTLRRARGASSNEEVLEYVVSAAPSGSPSLLSRIRS